MVLILNRPRSKTCFTRSGRVYIVTLQYTCSGTCLGFPHLSLQWSSNRFGIDFYTLIVKVPMKWPHQNVTSYCTHNRSDKRGWMLIAASWLQHTLKKNKENLFDILLYDLYVEIAGSIVCIEKNWAGFKQSLCM